MSEYKLIGLDMDGTLLNSKKKITPENMAAIEKAFSQGMTHFFPLQRLVEIKSLDKVALCLADRSPQD